MHIYTLRYNIIQRIKQLNYLMLIALLVLFNLPLHAQARLRLGGQIDLHHNNATAKEILDELAAKSGYDFSFDPAEFAHLKLTNIYYNDASLDKILLELEKKTYLQFMVSGKHISASINRNKKLKQRQGRIGGKIVDDRGEALPGATIKILELNLFRTSQCRWHLFFKPTSRHLYPRSKLHFVSNKVDYGCSHYRR